MPLRNVAPIILNLTGSRPASSIPTKDPKVKAQSLLSALPGNSLVSKTAMLSTATGISVVAISNELYVMNEETVIAFCLLSVFAAAIKYCGPAYGEWAQGQVEKHKEILNTARADHTNAVMQRINSVKQLSGAVEVTKQLFAISKVIVLSVPLEEGNTDKG